MAISIVGSFQSTDGTLTATPTGPTLPAALATGDLGVMVIHVPQATGFTLNTPPSGWTVVAGPIQAGGNNTITWLLTKSLGAADSSTVLSWTFSAASRHASAGYVIRGATLDATSSVATHTTLTGSFDSPAFTPVAADCLAVLVGGCSYGISTGGGTHTPAAGWTEAQDVSTAVGSVVNPGAMAASKQLTGQAGVLQSSASFAATNTHRDNSWVLTYAPIIVPTTSPGTLGDTLTYSMNRVAGTLVGGRPTLAATGAANVWAGTTGLALVGALNVKAGNTLPNYKGLQGVLNQLAGTTGLGVAAAAASILA